MSTTLPLRHRLILALYPLSFRERYGEELQALVEDTSKSRRVAFDLALGAAKAWIGPKFGGTPEQQQRSRLLATILTVLWSWSLVLVALGSFNKMVNDPAVNGLRQPVTAVAFQLALVSMYVATGLIMIGAVIYWGVIAAASRRERNVRTLVLASTPAGAGLIWYGATWALAWLLTHVVVGHQLAPTTVAALVVVVLIWALLSVVLAAVSWMNIALAMRRANLSVKLLRPGLIGAVAVASSLTVAVGSMAVTILALRGPGGLPPTVENLLLGYGAVPAAAVVTVIAAVSVRRGLRVNRENYSAPRPSG
jgi:hypothetical protein